MNATGCSLSFWIWDNTAPNAYDEASVVRNVGRDGSKMSRQGGVEMSVLSVSTACVCVSVHLKGVECLVSSWSGLAMKLKRLMNLR